MLAKPRKIKNKKHFNLHVLYSFNTPIITSHLSSNSFIIARHNHFTQAFLHKNQAPLEPDFAPEN